MPTRSLFIVLLGLFLITSVSSFRCRKAIDTLYDELVGRLFMLWRGTNGTTLQFKARDKTVDVGIGKGGAYSIEEEPNPFYDPTFDDRKTIKTVIFQIKGATAGQSGWNGYYEGEIFKASTGQIEIMGQVYLDSDRIKLNEEIPNGVSFKAISDR